MRLRLEFTTEPFDLDEPPGHALVAREVVEGAGLDAVDVGPFGNTAEGSTDTVVAAVGELLRRTLAAGATRVSLQVNVVDGAVGADGADVIGDADGADAAGGADGAGGDGK